MTDELERIRALRDAAPAPSEDWARQTRAELLALAAEETEGRERRAATAPGWPARWRERLRMLLAGPGRLAAAATLLVAVVTVGIVLTTASPQDPSDRVAGPTGPQESGSAPAPGSDDGDPPGTDPDGSGPRAEADGRSGPQASSDNGTGGGHQLASSCQGENGAYTISYPEDWHTNSGEVSEPCQYFDREPVELTAATGGAPEHPITVRLLPVRLDAAAEPDRAEEQTTRRTTTVAGRDAVVVEATATGEGAIPEGTRSYRYLIDLDGERTLLVAARELAGDGLAEYRRTADEMVASLQLGDD